VPELNLESQRGAVAGATFVLSTQQCKDNFQPLAKTAENRFAVRENRKKGLLPWKKEKSASANL
jgi:hypothetical protein